MVAQRPGVGVGVGVGGGGVCPGAIIVSGCEDEIGQPLRCTRQPSHCGTYSREQL